MNKIEQEENVKIVARKEIKKRSMMQESLERLVRNKTAMAGFTVIVVVSILCALAGVICPEGYDAQDVTKALIKPGKEFLFGTDNLGRSMLARVLYGGRVSLTIGIISTSISATLGLILGALAGYYGNKVDNIIMRTLDVFHAIPNTLLAIAISSAMGGGIVNAMIAVGISGVPNFAKIVRAPILAIKEDEFVEAARSIDATNRRIIFRHILPNVLSPIIITITGHLAGSILAASALSFLGLGVQPPQPEWGSLIANSRQYIRDYPYLVSIPGLAIASVVLSMNLFGDGLRDALDPKLKN
jgi:peptide/nickel transport system permease protein